MMKESLMNNNNSNRANPMAVLQEGLKLPGHLVREAAGKARGRGLAPSSLQMFLLYSG